MPSLSVPRNRPSSTAPPAASPSSFPSYQATNPQSHPFVHARPQPPKPSSTNSTNTPASSVAPLPKPNRSRRARIQRGRRKRPSSDEDDEDETGPPQSDDDDDDDRRRIDTDEEEERLEAQEAAKAAQAAVSSFKSTATVPPPSAPKAGKTITPPAPSATSISVSSAPRATPIDPAAVKTKKKRTKKPKAPKVTSSTLPPASTQPTPSLPTASTFKPTPPPAPTAAATASASSLSCPPPSAQPSTSKPPPFVAGRSMLNWSDDVSTDAPLPEIDFADLGKVGLGLTAASEGMKKQTRTQKASSSAGPSSVASRSAAPSPAPSTVARPSSTSAPVTHSKGPRATAPVARQQPGVVASRATPSAPASKPPPTGPSAGRNARASNAVAPSKDVEIRTNVPTVNDKRVFGPTTLVHIQPSKPARLPPAPKPSTLQPSPQTSTSTASSSLRKLSLSAVPPSPPVVDGAAASEKSKRALKKEKVERKIQKSIEEKARKLGMLGGAPARVEEPCTRPPAVGAKVVALATSAKPGAVRVKLPGSAGPCEEVKLSPREAKRARDKERWELANGRKAAEPIASGSGSKALPKEVALVVVRLPAPKSAAPSTVASSSRAESVVEEAGRTNDTPALSDLASSIHSAITPSPQLESNQLVIEHPQPRRHPSESNVLYKSPVPEPASLPVQPPMLSPNVDITLGSTTGLGLASAAPTSSLLPPSDVPPPPPHVIQVDGEEPPTRESEQPPRYELPPGRPHPREEQFGGQRYPLPQQYYTHPNQIGGPGGYQFVDDGGRRMSGGPDSPTAGMYGGGGTPTLPPGFITTENGQVFDAAGQQYIFSYSPSGPPPPQQFLPPHLRQHSQSPAFWGHGQPPSPSHFAANSPSVVIGGEGPFPGSGYSPNVVASSPSYPDGNQAPFGSGSFDHGPPQQTFFPPPPLDHLRQGPYPPPQLQHQSQYPPPPHFHPAHSPPPQQQQQHFHQHQHQFYPQQHHHSGQPFFVPRRQGFAPVRIADPHAKMGGMVPSSHIPVLPKASLGFQPVSYASYQHLEGAGGGPLARASSFDSDRTNEAYNGSEYTTYQ